MTEEKKITLNKIGTVLLNNGLLLAFVLYIIVCGIFCSSFNWKWFLWLLISCFIGWLFSYFYKKLEAEDEMPIEPVSYNYKYDAPKSWKERWKNTGQSLREMSGWSYLRWVLTISFLTVACYIMHESLSSLWLNEEGLGGIFCWFLSVIVIVTLFWVTGWLTHKLPYIESEYKKLFIVSCVGLYLLFDIAAFTFNYFHIYSNFGETQIMAQAVRTSEELSKYITPKISSKKQNVNTILDSINQLNDPINCKIKKFSAEIDTLKNQLRKEQKTIIINGVSQYNNVYGLTEKRIKTLVKNIERLDGNIIKPQIINNKNAIFSADTLLQKMDTLILQFNTAKIANNKVNQRTLKSSIVKAEGELYGKLDSILQSDPIITKYHIIINTKTIDQNKALNDLFELLGGQYTENHSKLGSEGEKEVHELLHKESFRSVALSALIDLAPILLALLVAFPTTNRRKRQ